MTSFPQHRVRVAARSRAIGPWRRVRRHLWVIDTPEGTCGVLLAGLRYVAIAADGRVMRRHLTLAAAQAECASSQPG